MNIDRARRRLTVFGYATFLAFLLLIEQCNATTPHTIEINGNLDEFDHATESSIGSENSMWYYTWDDESFFVGVHAQEIVEQNGKDFVTIYFDTDPHIDPTDGSGSLYGLDYPPAKVRVPFAANLVIEIRISTEAIHVYKWGRWR
jgi:hypothetical protein